MTDELSCRHPFGCQAPGEGCIGPCSLSGFEAERIEADFVLHAVYPSGTHTAGCEGCLWSQERTR